MTRIFGEFVNFFSHDEIVDICNCIYAAADHGLAFGQESLAWDEDQDNEARQKRKELADRLFALYVMENKDD